MAEENKQNQPALDPNINREQQKQVTTEGQTGQTTDKASMNPTNSPAAAQQSGQGTQPSQTLNPDSPESPAGQPAKGSASLDPNAKIKVQILQGKHKYIDPVTREGRVADAGNADNNTLTIDQRTFDRYPGRFKIV